MRVFVVQDEHRPVGIVAWVVLVTHIVGFPITTFVYLFHRRFDLDLQSTQWQTAWKSFVDTDYAKLEFFWLTRVQRCAAQDDVIN